MAKSRKTKTAKKRKIRPRQGAEGAACEPTHALPGTDAKIAVLQRRLKDKLSLFCKEDPHLLTENDDRFSVFRKLVGRSAREAFEVEGEIDDLGWSFVFLDKEIFSCEFGDENE